MRFLKRFILAVILLPAAVYAWAPVENLTQSQGQDSNTNSDDSVQTGAVTSPPAPTPASPPAPGQADNTPLVSPSSVPTDNQGNSTTDLHDNPGVSVSALPIPDRVAHLEQQIKNLTQLNMPDQLTNLQQQVQQLSGELQVQQHNIDLLNQQLRNFYKDLQSQIKQNKVVSGASPAADSSSLEENTPSSPSATPPSDDTTVDNYKKALTLLTKKQYPAALKAFQAYLKTSPTGHFAASAHYWIGEIYVQMKNLKSASVEYRHVIQDFPHSDKISDAEVKLAIIHASQGNTVQARAEFIKIKQEYPGTTAAQLADIQLQQLGSANNNAT